MENNLRFFELLFFFSGILSLIFVQFSELGMITLSIILVFLAFFYLPLSFQKKNTIGRYTEHPKFYNISCAILSISTLGAAFDCFHFWDIEPIKYGIFIANVLFFVPSLTIALLKSNKKADLMTFRHFLAASVFGLVYMY
ncbi:MAG: hypothetical protein ACEPOV_13900 [Hyphomicrobiales bacterium]